MIVPCDANSRKITVIFFEESTFATRSKVCANCTWVWRKNDGLQTFDQKSNAGVRKGVFPVLSL